MICCRQLLPMFAMALLHVTGSYTCCASIIVSDVPHLGDSPSVSSASAVGAGLDIERRDQRRLPEPDPKLPELVTLGLTESTTSGANTSANGGATSGSSPVSLIWQSSVPIGDEQVGPVAVEGRLLVPNSPSKSIFHPPRVS